MSQIIAKALRPFHGEEGFKNSDSEPFPVTRQRFADLKANGLVEEVTVDAKAAPAPENKMMDAPVNKAAAASKTKAI